MKLVPALPASTFSAMGFVFVSSDAVMALAFSKYRQMSLLPVIVQLFVPMKNVPIGVLQFSAVTPSIFTVPEFLIWKICLSVDSKPSIFILRNVPTVPEPLISAKNTPWGWRSALSKVRFSKVTFEALFSRRFMALLPRIMRTPSAFPLIVSSFPEMSKRLLGSVMSLLIRMTSFVDAAATASAMLLNSAPEVWFTIGAASSASVSPSSLRFLPASMSSTVA